MTIIEDKLAELGAWLRGNVDRVNTPEYRRTTMAHRLFTDLVARNGGSDAEKAYALNRLKEIQEDR